MSELATLTESWIPFINPTILLMFRIIATFGTFYLAGIALNWVGFVNVPFYFSEWSVLITFPTQLLFLWSHFRPYDPYFDNLAKALFELTVPMLVWSAVGFWGIFYDDGWPVDFSVEYNYMQFFVHGVPLFFMLIELLVNSITFDIEEGALRMLWITAAYLPVQFFSKFIRGYYPYGELDFTTFKGWEYFLGPMLGGMGFYYIIAYFTNLLKDR